MANALIAQNLMVHCTRTRKSKSLHALLLLDLSSSDLMVVKLEQVSGKNVFICSAYMAHGRLDPSKEMQYLVSIIGATFCQPVDMLRR